MGNGENFTKYIEPVADRLGAAMGASRAAVDAGSFRTIGRSGRQARSLLPTSIWRSVFQALFSISRV